ncbi:hypothetical protein LIER_42999 [Lithospermum erythrorhizon]|uniref:Reverse transcriptase domain-containing protein n=1 Tax=Lithospermum erythrorhizon TaxID=34254 RepID=A0AAV3PAS0_LITER
MSPALFLFCLEYFSRLCRVRKASPAFAFHPMCGDVGITHLAFADDVMLFRRGDFSSVDIMMGCLSHFESCSGLAVNPTKSSVYLAGVRGSKRAAILARVGLQEGTFPKWGNFTLSYTGRLELISSVIQGVESFWLRAYPIPPAIVSKITSLCTSFLWGGSKKEKVKFDDICASKDEGGLCFKDVQTWNSALLASALWALRSHPESLWVQWVHGHYLKGVYIWDYVKGRRDSLLMRSLCDLRDTLATAYGGRGEAIEGLASCCVGGKLVSKLV